MHSYRVFISYSHEDRERAVKIEEHLNSMGLTAICDRGILPGTFFTDQIKNGIAFAHAFVPLLTVASTSRTWVHQEIGYAVGVGVPVLPLALGELPAGIIHGVQALSLKSDLSNLSQCLTAKEIERIVRRVQPAIPCECAFLPEERTSVIVRYASSVLEFGYKGKVRQRGALTSFCLPDKPTNNPIWRQRDGKLGRQESYHKLQREERRTLERHARERGCDLIIDPSISFESSVVKFARISTLREFLASMPSDKARVVVQKAEIRDNLLLVGDWYLAHSISPRKGRGYLQTVFSRHAPTVLEKMEQFDEEFEESLRDFVRDGRSSRDLAIEAIDRELSIMQNDNY